jgi:hypothetical protein
MFECPTLDVTLKHNTKAQSGREGAVDSNKPDKMKIVVEPPEGR